MNANENHPFKDHPLNKAAAELMRKFGMTPEHVDAEGNPMMPVSELMWSVVDKMPNSFWDGMAGEKLAGLESLDDPKVILEILADQWQPEELEGAKSLKEAGRMLLDALFEGAEALHLEEAL